jgi:hypothetical protein
MSYYLGTLFVEEIHLVILFVIGLINRKLSLIKAPIGYHGSISFFDKDSWFFMMGKIEQIGPQHIQVTTRAHVSV